MKKAQYAQRGPVPQDVIEAIEFTLPALQPGQALVEVLAAPINPSDVLTLTGQYGILPPLPATGGNEGVGRVVEVGSDVSGLAAGQTVLLPVGCGTWATHLIADAQALLPLPDDADPRQLAMMTVNPPTAQLLLTEFVNLKPGDWVIQNAANSAVGGYLVQLAKRRGLNTVNVVRRDSAAAAVTSGGGEVVLVDGPDLATRVAEATGKAAIGLAIDAVGGPATDHLASCLVNGGTVVNYGVMSGERCQIAPQALIFRDIRLHGFWLSRWYQSASAERRTTLFGGIARQIAKGEISARIQASYGIDQIRQAVAAAAAGERDGKIILEPNA